MPYAIKAFLVSFIFWMIPTVAYAVYTNEWGHCLRCLKDSESFAILFWGTAFSLFFSVLFALKEAETGNVKL